MQWEKEGKHARDALQKKNNNNKIQWLQTSPFSGIVIGLFLQSALK